MALLTPIVPTRTGAPTTGAAVAASDTINAAALGARGAYLEILNTSGSTDSITVSDAGRTPAGTPGGTYAISLLTGNTTTLLIVPSQLDPVTGVVTVTHTQTTSVTCKLFPIG